MEGDLKMFILDRRELLTRQQQKLATFVLENMREIPFLAVPVLARRAEVSEATVVRFSQRLGYDGFIGLKNAFVEHLHDRKQNFDPPPTGESTLEMVVGQEIANVHKCLEGNDLATFDAAATLIAGSEMVFCFGAGASSIVADYCAYLFNQVGMRAAPISPRYSTPLELLVTLKKGDHLCCFSFPPYSEVTISLLKAANSRNITSTAFCDRISAPISKWGDHALVAPSEGCMFTNSYTALMALVNALATEVGKKNGIRILEAVDQINESLNDSDTVNE